MSLTLEEVQHIALLTRLGLTPQELERYRLQLESILDNFQLLQNVNTEGVKATSYAVPLENVLRDDESKPSSSKEDVLANAPRRENDYFRVRAVLD